MYRRGFCFLLLIVAWLLSGCKTLFKMQLPSEADNTNFRSDAMHARPFRATGTTVFDFRVIKDSVNYAGSADSTLTFGIIVPRSRVVSTRTDRTRTFGNDSLQCKLLYYTHDIYIQAESHSLLGDIMLPPEKYKRDIYQEPTSVTYYYRHFNGIVRNDADSAIFNYEETRSKHDIDTSAITGFILVGRDTLVLKPYFLPIRQNTNKKKHIYMLEGLGFYKQGRLQAFLQYAPLIEPGREKLHLRIDTTPLEQLLIAAYFTLFYDRL